MLYLGANFTINEQKWSILLCFLHKNFANNLSHGGSKPGKTHTGFTSKRSGLFWIYFSLLSICTWVNFNMVIWYADFPLFPTLPVHCTSYASVSMFVFIELPRRKAARQLTFKFAGDSLYYPFTFLVYAHSNVANLK